MRLNAEIQINSSHTQKELSGLQKFTELHCRNIVCCICKI